MIRYNCTYIDSLDAIVRIFYIYAENIKDAKIIAMARLHALHPDRPIAKPWECKIVPERDDAYTMEDVKDHITDEILELVEKYKDNLNFDPGEE